MGRTCPFCGEQAANEPPIDEVVPSCARCGKAFATAVESSLKPDDSGEFVVKPAAKSEQQAIRLPDRQMTPAPGQPIAGAPSPVARAAASAPRGVDSSEPLRMEAAAVGSVKLPDFAPARAPGPNPKAADTVHAKRQAAGETHPTPVPSPLPAPTVRVPADRVRIDLNEDPNRLNAIPYQRWRKRIRVSARKLEQPAACACCLARPDATFDAVHVRTKGSRSSEHAWTFPYCLRCLDHVAKAGKARRRSALAGWLTFGVALVFGIVIQLWLVAVVIAPIVAAATWFAVRRSQLQAMRHRLSPACACSGPAVRYAGFHGSVQTFDFASEGFATQFEQANAAKLVQ